MTIRPAEARLKPPPSEADRKAVRAFWRGLFIGFFTAGILGNVAGWLT